MKLAVVQGRVYRFWNISGPRRRSNANREPDQKETWLLMANSDPMERGAVAAPSISTTRHRPFIVSGGDH
jgi:hypothetical protein